MEGNTTTNSFFSNTATVPASAPASPSGKVKDVVLPAINMVWQKTKAEIAALEETIEGSQSVATYNKIGLVRPDEDTIVIDENGVISAKDIIGKYCADITYVGDELTILDQNGDAIRSVSIVSGSGGGGGVPLADPTYISITNLDESALIKWTDPDNTMLGDVALAEWGGTLVIRKAGSAPEHKNDGTIVVDSKIKNQYQTIGFTDNNLTNGVTYYYGIFPYSKDKVYNIHSIIEFTPVAIYPNQVTNINICAGYKSVTVSFDTDATITEVDLVYKAGSAPVDKTDGIIVNNITSAQTISGLANGTTYYFVLYAKNAKNREVPSGSYSSTPFSVLLDEPASVSITNADGSSIIKWTDPSNKTQNGVAAEWGGTLVIRKIGSAPSSISDGIVVLDSKTKNAYSTTGYIDENLTNGATYYYGIFPYTTNNEYTTTFTQSFTPQEIYPTAVTVINTEADNESVKITYTLPGDALSADLVYKAGEAPNVDIEGTTVTSTNDGIVLQNFSSGTIVTGLTNDVDYYFVLVSKNNKQGIESSTFVCTPTALTIVTFSAGTDAEIAAMLQAHYNDQIDIADYWSVGDTRVISLNEVSAPNPNSSSKWEAQNITIVITAIEHHDLATPINGHTKAAITCQTRECLNNNSQGANQAGHIYINGDSAYDMTFTKWSNLYMRTYLNDTWYPTAMPTALKNVIKPTVHNRLTNYNQATTEQVTDTVFLPSYPEIFGNVPYGSYLNGSTLNGEEGTQWEYYQTSSNRIKNSNNNGVSNGVKQYWWEGSASSRYDSSYGYYWCSVYTDGGSTHNYGTGARGLAPAFAM